MPLKSPRFRSTWPDLYCGKERAVKTEVHKGDRLFFLILLKTLRSSFESLRTNGGAIEIIVDFSFY
jgi:hypothetical protein